MLSKDLERALNESFKQARAQRHEFITVEHLLLALLDDSAAQRVLKACGVNIESLRGDLTEFIDSTTPLVSGEAELIHSRLWVFSAFCSALSSMCRAPVKPRSPVRMY